MYPITRRHCLKTFGSMSLLALDTGFLWANKSAETLRHIPLQVGKAPDLLPESGLTTGFLRFGWKAFAVGNAEGETSHLLGLGDAAPDVPDDAICRLRLTNAIDIRDAYDIEVSTPGGQLIGRFDLRYAGLYQVQEIPLSPSQARAVLAQGAVLHMRSGGKPVWFFAPSPGASPAPDPVQLPHLLIATPGGDPAAAFEQRLRGRVMLQGFGWQSGCVSEGMLDLAELRRDAAILDAVDRYLAMYFTDRGVVFENPRSQLLRDEVGGIEEPLPWATLARRQPAHPALEIARAFLVSDAVNKHDLSRGQALTTEGNYTAAYPSAVLSRVLNLPELATLALRQLEARRLACVHEGDIYQRAAMGGRHSRLRNWCRGVCWYYLGMVRTLEALGDENVIASWLPEIRRVAAFLRLHQRADGLWGNVIHDPQSAVDTSGSAGLAAALARAQAAGWLDADARASAQQTLAGLRSHLTPDGLLGGAAQSNKGGNALQQGDYRVIYQMGMGLKAQLLAALGA